MDNKELAHLWANQSRQSARGSHFYFEGDTIYSYGTHFPIARHYKGAILFTSQSYSNSTARHKSYVRSAISHREVFTVVNPRGNPCGEDVKNYGERINTLATNAAKARNPDDALRILESEISEANKFCERFGFKTRFAIPSGEAMDKLKEKAKAAMGRKCHLGKRIPFAELPEDCQKLVVRDYVEIWGLK